MYLTRSYAGYASIIRGSVELMKSASGIAVNAGVPCGPSFNRKKRERLERFNPPSATTALGEQMGHTETEEQKMTAANMMNVERAIVRIRALRKLEKMSFSRTTNAQNEILRSLNSADLAEVALILTQESESNDPASPRKQ
jgi:hypothetical protein